MKKTEIMTYFKKAKEHVKRLPKEYDIPTDMKEGDSWKLMESAVTEEDIQALENEFHILFPEEYKEYLMVAAHMFDIVTGNVDNFLFEDDVDIALKIAPQPYKEELKYLKEVFVENNRILENGYIPLGEMINEESLLCIDTQNDNCLVWFDFEEIVGAGSREDFENAAMLMFGDFSDYIKCFFGGETIYIEDEDEADEE